MPTYEYKCENCQTCFTVQAGMQDPAPVQGPNCQAQNCQIKKRLSRVFGQVAGAHQAPAQAQPTAQASPESPTHVCSKYCDMHK